MKFISTLILGLMLSLNLSAQQAFLEVFSGYNFTAYDLDELSESQGYVPIGIRIAGGFEKFQIGLEYHQNISNPTFNQQDLNGVNMLRTEIETTYKGALLRLNLSSLPAYRFGVVVKAGAGFYDQEFKTFLLPEETSVDIPDSYEPKVGFNGGIGISAPIYTLLHWEIGYMYHMIKWDANNNQSIPSYNGHYHSIQVGLSLNLVFGKTKASCARKIKGDRSKRGW